MSTETISVTELEEHFSLDVPCGGNKFPHNRPCPDQAAAIVRRKRCCSDADKPYSFKCLLCYTEWATASRQMSQTGCCKNCGLTMPINWWYHPL